MNIHWMRIVLGALLLEVILAVVLIPISFVNETLFFTLVPIGAFGFGYLVTRWLLRRLTAGWLLHGALVGVVATVMYVGLTLLAPGGYSAVVDSYGAPLFYLSNVLRIGGCLAGGLHAQRRATAGRPSTPHGV
jgi:hypothetical protein